MPTPFDYETNPQRFRLATRVTSQHLMAARSLYELLAEELTRLDPRRILDIGCGEGALRSALPARLASRTVGLDASVTMLGAHPPPVVQADATALPFMVGVFDVAVAVNVLDHLADPTVAIGEAGSRRRSRADQVWTSWALPCSCGSPPGGSLNALSASTTSRRPPRSLLPRASAASGRRCAWTGFRSQAKRFNTRSRHSQWSPVVAAVAPPIEPRIDPYRPLAQSGQAAG